MNMPSESKSASSNKNEQQSSKRKDNTNKSRLPPTDKTWYLVLGVVIALSLATRLYKVDEPDHVCWDETHFGKMASWYINRTFFFDVHPPLGKMMIGFFGYATGYNATFPFVKPGDKYEDTKYLGMRVCCALLGACLAPFLFVTVWDMTSSIPASVFSSSLILFDIGTITLTTYILLDPPLLFFIMGAVMGITRVDRLSDREFSKEWWFWLSFTGTFLASAISVKFVGLFVVLYVGLVTIKQLWITMGDLSKPLSHTVKHFGARVGCLILLPVFLYIFFFYIHLRVLYKSGPGDGHFSSAFQSVLEGNFLNDAQMPRDLSYGADITLKHSRVGGGYLHSHWHLYPEGVGARQQQVTTYAHKDDNNRFFVKQYDRTPLESDPPKVLKNGDLLRLEHIITGRNLHSHKEPAPVTKRHYQITCYGENGTGDANDVWKINIPGGGEKEVVQTVTTKFQLVHYLTGCVLHSHNKQLPKWAWEQMEVTCNPNIRDPGSIWNIEDNFYDKLPNVSVDLYAPGFLSRFIEAHQVMLQSNAGLKPKEGEMTSRPWHWPINLKGQYFSAPPFRVYLLGNPVIWWGNLAFLGLFLFLFVYHSVKAQRGCEIAKEVKERTERMTNSCLWLYMGWLLHYVPFWAMTRVLYFHHYFPALLFSSMITGIVVDYLLESLPLFLPAKMVSGVYHWLVGVFFSCVIYSFYLFSPLTYGMGGPEAKDPNSTMYNLKWMDSWEF